MNVKKDTAKPHPYGNFTTQSATNYSKSVDRVPFNGTPPIQNSDRLYWQLLNATHAKIAFVNRDAVFQYASNAFCELFERQLSEVLGQQLYSVIPLDLIRNEFDGVIENPDTAGRPFVISTKKFTSAEKHIQIHLEPCDRGGVIVHIKEISNQKMFEPGQARLFQAIEQSIEGIAILNGDGRFAYTNNAFANMFGYRDEGLIGQSWRILFGADQISELDDVFTPHLHQGGQWRGRIKGRRKDESLFDIESATTLIADKSDEKPEIICTTRDVSAQNQTNEAFHELKKLDAIGRLTGGVAHDFNNFLAVISGNIDLAMVSKDEAKRNRYLKTAFNASERAVRLTGQLQAFARKQPMLTIRADMSVLVQCFSDLLKSELDNDIVFITDIHPELWRCKIDPNQLESAIWNLVANARDAMPSGGKVTLHANNSDLRSKIPQNLSDIIPGKYVCIAVEDTGTGIDPEIIDSVIEPFFTTKPSGVGSGLGLAVTYGFAKQSGGYFFLDSHVDQGTIAKLYLPALED